jgi:hypothetical protein
LIHLGPALVHVLDLDDAHHVLRLGTDLVAGERPVVVDSCIVTRPTNRNEFDIHAFSCYTCLRGGNDGNTEYHTLDP